MKDLLTPRQVALAIGVSEASLKRWCDKGLIPMIRTAGGHRRLPIDGVVQFLRQRGHPIVRPELLGLPLNTGTGDALIERASGQFRDALKAGDDEQARRTVFTLFLAGRTIPEIGDRVMAPAFHTLGERWQHGEVEVYEERRGCEICSRILYHLRMVLALPKATAPLAIGGTLEGDPYTIPNALVELTLREAGWRAESYGTGLPIVTLCAAIEEIRPRLLWLSVSTVRSISDFPAEWTALSDTAGRCGTALVVGGRGLTEEVRRQLQYSAFCDSLQHLVSFARAFERSRSEPRNDVMMPQ